MHDRCPNSSSTSAVRIRCTDKPLAPPGILPSDFRCSMGRPVGTDGVLDDRVVRCKTMQHHRRLSLRTEQTSAATGNFYSSQQQPSANSVRCWKTARCQVPQPLLLLRCTFFRVPEVQGERLMRVRMDVSVSILFIFVERGAGAPRAWCPVRSSRDGRLFLARACRTHSSLC